ISPGASGLKEIEKILAKIPLALVFISPNGLGQWQREEIDVLLAQSKKRDILVIPVILPDVQGEPDMPLFLANKQWVDLRTDKSQKLQQLMNKLLREQKTLVSLS